MRRLAFCTLLWTLAAGAAAAQPAGRTSVRERPTWGEAWVAGAATGGGMLAGGAAGMNAELALSSPDCGCLAGLLGALGGGALGAATGALGARLTLGQRRGSVLGAIAGSVLGVAVGASVPIDPNGVGNAVAMPVLAVAGAAAGYRYGPWAKGPGRRARVAVSAVPVVAPGGTGVYAVVRF